MARIITLVFFGLLVSQQCSPRSLPDEEDSVVSVYTQPNGASGDVYHQIANNIAERITSPLYRFLGIKKNSTQSINQTATTKRPWDKLELLEDAQEDNKVKTITNDISRDKEVEELSDEALKKKDRKPEKVTLYSNYLPVKGKIELNDTINEIGDGDDDGDDFGFEDVDPEPKPREGPFVYVLELFGSLIQLLYGGFIALFSSNKSS